MFSVLWKTNSSFDYKVLMSIYIKFFQPSHCKQQEWLLDLNMIIQHPLSGVVYFSRCTNRLSSDERGMTNR